MVNKEIPTYAVGKCNWEWSCGTLWVVAGRPAQGVSENLILLADMVSTFGPGNSLILTLALSEAQMRALRPDSKLEHCIFDKTPNRSVQDICDRIGNGIAEEGVKTVVIDYAQLITDAGEHQVLMRLKELASRRGIHIIVGSAVALAKEKPVHAPTAADLSFSEQEKECIDMLLTCHNPAYYKRAEKKTKQDELSDWLDANPGEDERDWLLEERCVSDVQREELKELFELVDSTPHLDLQVCPSESYKVESDTSDFVRHPDAETESVMVYYDFAIGNCFYDLDAPDYYDGDPVWGFFRWKARQLGLENTDFPSVAREEMGPSKHNYIRWRGLVKKYKH